MKRVISWALIVLLTLGMINWNLIGTIAADYEYAWFPAPVMQLTQLAYESYSHGDQNAIDIAPGGTVFAPFTGTIVYADSNWGYVVLQSANKVYWADGTCEYMSVGFMHDEYIGDLYVGKTISQGQGFYHAGGMGDGNPNAYGDHVHITVHYGRVTRGYPYGNGDRYAFNAFFVNSEKTYATAGRGEGYMVSGNWMNNGAPSDYRGRWLNLSEADTNSAYENLGDDFYTYIKHPASGYGISNVNGNVELGDYPDTSSLWHFVRNSGNSYQIFSAVDDNAMDVQDNLTADHTNIQTYAPNTTSAQKWYIKAVGSGYSLISASSRKALDIANGSTDYGTNAGIYSQNGTAAQILELDMNIDRTCTIQFYDQNGNVWMPDECDAGAAYTVPITYPLSNGEYFSGWAYEQGSEVFDVRPGDTITVTENIALYPLYISHADAISGQPVPIYNIDDFTQTGYKIAEQDYQISRQETTGYWTDWSSYSTTKVTASDTVEVKTAAMYRYYYYLCSSCGDHNPLAGGCGCGGYSNDFRYKWFTTPYSQSSYQTVSYATSKCVTTALGDGQQWYFSSGNKNHTAIGTVDSDSSSVVITTGYSSRSYVSQTQTTTQTVKAYVIAANNHGYIYTVETRPTATQAGSLMGICYECHQLITITLPALNSTDYTYAVETAATCAADGTATYTYTAPADRTVYFDNAIDQWAEVYVYTWSDDGEYSGGWPGVAMSPLGGGLFAYNVPDGADYIIFNNHDNGIQTEDLTIPSDGKNLFDGYGWSVFDAYRSFSFDVTLPKTGHSYHYGYGTAPTTSTTGTLTGICSTCQGTTTVTVPKFNTTDYTSSVTEATCTTDGKAYYSWNNKTYGNFSYIITLEKTGHSHTAAVTEPTCTESGYTTYTCHCGDTYTADEVAALGHKYQAVITTAPGCSSAGVKCFTCQVCGDSYTEPMAATGHNYNAVVTEPTCTEKGYTTYTCACGHSYTADEKPATGHNLETSGPTMVESCQDREYFEFCYDCDYRYSYIIPGSHKYQTVTVDATCVTDGSVTSVCVICNDTQAEVLSATGHSYTSEVTAPTCANAGYTTYTCHCGDSYRADETPALDHSYRITTVAPTCTVAGSMNAVCTVCEDSKVVAMPATGHTPGQWVVVREETITEDGLLGQYCTVCNELLATEIVDNYASGICGDGLTWYFDPDTGSLTISGVGAMFDYSNGTAPWYEYSASIVKVAVEAGVTTIGNYAFAGLTKMETISLPEGMTWIGEYAFYIYGWNAYPELTFSGDAPQFSDTAFENTCVVIHYPESNETWTGDVMFPVKGEHSCYGGWVSWDSESSVIGMCGDDSMAVYDKQSQKLTITGNGKINSSEGGVKLPWSNYKSEVTEVVIANGCPSIADAFYGHTRLKNISLPDSLESIGEDAFGRCTSLEQISIPENVKKIGPSAFGNCTSLETITFCSDAPEMETDIFKNVVATAYYPGGNTGWTADVMQNYGGEITWVAYGVPAVVQPTLTLKAPTLEFKDMITVNAMFTAENLDSVVEMGMITYSSKVAEWSVETAEHMIPGTKYDADTGRYIASSQGIHAKYLGDTVYLACYAKLTDGSYVYTKLAGYSPVQYAASKLGGTDTALKQLVVAMLNYGAAAQTHFEHNVEKQANATLTAEQIALPDSYRDDMVGTVPAADDAKQGAFYNNKGFAKRYPAISFEGAFCINYFFNPNYTPMDGITLYYWNEADFTAANVLTKENASGTLELVIGDGLYRGDITGIAAKDLSGAIYVAAVYSDGTTEWTSGVLGYSIGAYCASQSTKGGTIADLAMATAVYGYHAKQYFG